MYSSQNRGSSRALFALFFLSLYILPYRLPATRCKIPSQIQFLSTEVGRPKKYPMQMNEKDLGLDVLSSLATHV